MHTIWEKCYAKRVCSVSGNAIQGMLKITEQPDIISFAGGLPAPELFPTEKITVVGQRVLRDYGSQALQYSATEGYRPLREQLAVEASQDGVSVDVDNVLMTSGSQQALDLLGKILINRGDTLIIEAPTYVGALQAWAPYGARYIIMPTDEQGMMLDTLEKALRSKPKFLYSMPNFQNPAGVTLSLERRIKLVRLAREYGVPIVEDDAYRQLRYEGEHLPSLLQLDAQEHSAHTPGNVIYLRSFSKVLAPGLRLGWVIAPAGVIRKLVQAKQGVDLHTPTFTQMVVHLLLRENFLDQHLPVLKQAYRLRRDTMLSAIKQQFPAGVRWNPPAGGMFLWIELPQEMNATSLLQEAVTRQVAFVPGINFYPYAGEANTLRLNFSFSPPEVIQKGIARLGSVLHEQASTLPCSYPENERAIYPI